MQEVWETLGDGAWGRTETVAEQAALLPDIAVHVKRYSRDWVRFPVDTPVEFEVAPPVVKSLLEHEEDSVEVHVSFEDSP